MDEDFRFIEQRWKAAGDPQDGEALWAALHKRHGGIPVTLTMLDDLCRFRRVQDAWEKGRGDNHGYMAGLMRGEVTLWERLCYLGYKAPRIDQTRRQPGEPEQEAALTETFNGYDYWVERTGDRAQVHRLQEDSSQPHLQTEILYTFVCTNLIRIHVFRWESVGPYLVVEYMVNDQRLQIHSHDGRDWVPSGTAVTFRGHHYSVEHSVDRLSISEWEETRRGWGAVCNTRATRYKRLRVVKLPRGIGGQDIDALLLPYEHDGKYFTLHSLDGHSWERTALTRKHYVAEYGEDG